jgi:hypothetical protein
MAVRGLRGVRVACAFKGEGSFLNTLRVSVFVRGVAGV